MTPLTGSSARELPIPRSRSPRESQGSAGALQLETTAASRTARIGSLMAASGQRDVLELEGHDLLEELAGRHEADRHRLEADVLVEVHAVPEGVGAHLIHPDVEVRPADVLVAVGVDQ